MNNLRENVPTNTVLQASASIESTEKMSVSEAIGLVNGCYQMAMGMGANDYEKSAFPEILRKLYAGEYDNPRDAATEAYSIVESKNAYH